MFARRGAVARCLCDGVSRRATARSSRRKFSSAPSPGSMMLRELIAATKIFVGGGIVVGGLAYAYEQYNISIDPPAPGQLVNVGTKNLHCEVSGNGGVTVLFEGGSGETTSDWIQVQRNLSTAAKCISYDRAGLGFSEAGAMPPSAQSMLDDTVHLLSQLGVRGPIVLVAHGAGALNARALVAACKDPNSPHYEKFSIDGVVLLDPQCEGVKDLHRSMHPSVDKVVSQMEDSNRTYAHLSHFGFGRWAMGNQIENMQQQHLYPLDRLLLLKASKSTAKHRMAMADEVEATAEIEDNLTSADNGGFPCRTVVLARGRKNMFDGLAAANVHKKIIERMEVVWSDAQQKLAEESQDGVVVEVENADMFMAQKNPDVVTKSIADMISIVNSTGNY